MIKAVLILVAFLLNLIFIYLIYDATKIKGIYDKFLKYTKENEMDSGTISLEIAEDKCLIVEENTIIFVYKGFEVSKAGKKINYDRETISRFEDPYREELELWMENYNKGIEQQEKNKRDIEKEKLYKLKEEYIKNKT